MLFFGVLIGFVGCWLIGFGALLFQDVGGILSIGALILRSPTRMCVFPTAIQSCAILILKPHHYY